MILRTRICPLRFLGAYLTCIFGVMLLVSVSLANAYDFDGLRRKWHDTLTLSTNANPANPDYAGWIAQIGKDAQGFWSSMNTNANRTYLWADLSGLSTNSSDITTTYFRLRAMALGHAVQGSSVETNVALCTALTNALDWMYINAYNEGKTEFDNWFDWEIGAPLNLNDITALMYDYLTAGQVANYMNSVNHFTPAPSMTGANRVWKAFVVALRGAIIQDGAQLTAGQQALSDVFRYVSNGDGFYSDGSFVFHSEFPYNGGYGVELLQTIGPMIQWLKGSAWEVTDPAQANLFQWIYQSFEPFIYEGAMMQLVSGRYFSREGDDHAAGHEAIAAILGVAQIAPPADAAAFNGTVKYWLTTDSYRDFITTQPPPFNVWARKVLNDDTITLPRELVRHYQFPQMDRAVHLRPGWAFAIAMSSSRIGNFESIHGENLRGWYTGDGMTYLYNGDLAQFADGYWPTVNAYRLPGTTVDTQSRADGSGEGYLSPNTWVGGSSIQDLYGVVGMHLDAWNSTLGARKSWFMFDNEVVCLGAGITAGSGRTIESVVENRRLAGYGNNALTVDGTSKPALVGWSETLTNVTWAHLSGNLPGFDIGYFFPQPTSIKAVREARAGSLYEINTNYGSTNQLVRNYLTLWVDHGIDPSNATYAYVLLPNQGSAQVAQYAANPGIVVVENSPRAQCVQKPTLGITAVNFWRDGTNRVGGITVDHKASVIFRNDGTFLELGVSDPTQTNFSGINVEIDAAAAATLSADSDISVLQLSPTIKLLATGSGGMTAHARFFVGPIQTASSVPVADAYVQNGDQTNANFGLSPTLAVKAADSSLAREAYLRFALPPAPGQILGASIRLVPITSYDPLLYHAMAFVSDNSWTETNLTWNNKPTSDPEFTRWALPPIGTPATVDVSPLAELAAATDGNMSVRIYSTGTPTPTNGYAAYASKESGTSSNRPQLLLSFGRVPPTVELASPANGLAKDAPATLTLEANAQGSTGALLHVDFYDGNRLLGGNDNPPFALTVSNLSAGQYSFTAVVTDNSGSSVTSAPVWVGVFDPEPVGRGTGLTGDYFGSQNFTGLIMTRVDPSINFSWAGSPGASMPADHFSVRWTGKLQARHAGVHKFHTVSDNGVRLWLNGQLLIDDWNSHSTSEDTGSISLLPGQYYDLSMEYYDVSGPAVAQLFWTEPGGAKVIIPSSQLYPADTGLRGDYFASTNLANGVFSRVDGTVNFSWGSGSPDPLLLRGPFSVRWTGKLHADQSGIYTFFTDSANGVRLWVNHSLLVNNWTAHPLMEDGGSISLAAGQNYDISMEFFHNSGAATAVLMWMPPGGSKGTVPAANLALHRNNSPPVLAPIPTMSVTRGRTLTFTVTAADPDTTSQALAFSLDSDAPGGATIDATTGLFTWTPPMAQALGAYNFTVRVTDNGTPPMTDARVATIAVTDTAISEVTLIPAGAIWDYLDGGMVPGADWRTNTFSNGTWKSGSAPLGYGTGREATVTSFGSDPNNKYITTYFRRYFYVPDAGRVQSITAKLVRDDGAVVYLNGVETWRDNMPTEATDFTTLALAPIDGSTETNFISRTFDPAGLVNGTNVIAVEIHLDSVSGPDTEFDFELSGVTEIPTEAPLTIERSFDGFEFHWPADAALLRLYSSSAPVAGAGWTPVLTPAEITGGECVVRSSLPSDGSRFYRLQPQ